MFASVWLSRFFEAANPASRSGRWSHPGRSYRRLGLESVELRVLLDASGMVDVAEGEPEEDFSLPDVNPTSVTYQQEVSPRDFAAEKATAWYFIHST